MTDYVEEQQNELEALQSIYPDEIEILGLKPETSFKIAVVPQNAEDFPDHAISAEIQFTYTPDYPDSAPLIEFYESDNMDDKQLDSLMELMKTQAEENLGMAMIFTLISVVQETMTDMMEQAAKDQVEDQQRRVREADELERKRFEGTRVSVEVFMSWKLKFDAEMAELKRLKGFDESRSKKPTGKELFLLDDKMIDSDVKFLQDEGDTLEVDESLFADLELDDDLLDEDEDDDPDYNPDD